MNRAENAARFDQAFDACGLIAILRGVRSEEVVAIADALFATGLKIIEVPLNSPDPFDSIARLSRHMGDKAVIGAGTVRTPEEVGALARAGGRIAVSPHCDPDVIRASLDHGLVPLPGVLSPTEAFAAEKAGARAVKLFPMEIIGAAGVKAMRAVLPKSLRLIAVGGVDAGNIAALAAAGCDGFGLGGSLYKPGDGPEKVAASARSIVAALRAPSSARAG